MPELPPYKVVQVAQLVPYARNARTHTDAQIAAIADSIREYGWTNPVLIDAAGGIIAGHGRVLAATLLGITEVPAIELAHLTEQQQRALVLADNKLAERAGWNQELLRMELSALQDAGFDMALTGFELTEIDSVLGIEAGGELLDPTDGHGDTKTTPRAMLAWGEMSWKKTRVPLTEEECQMLDRALKKHLTTFGSDFGFVRETLARIELRD